MPNIQWRSSAALMEGEFPPRQIVGWQEMNDYPEWSEAELLQGIQCSEHEFKVISNCAGVDENELRDFSYLPTPEAAEHNQRGQRSNIVNNFMSTTRMHPLEGDKLSGYPHWVQDVEYPNCPVCDRRMDQFIFEFASDDDIPYLWGDVGSGYVVQCPEHNHQVTFIWQCG
jgi:uncharacterized protein YwqG